MEQIAITQQAFTPAEISGEHLFREHAETLLVPRQSLVYSPGDPADQFYAVIDGEVKVSRYTSDGRELTLAHLGAGEVFGDVELLLGRPRESQVQARGNCTLSVLERDEFHRLVRESPAFGLWLTQRVSERQSRMEDRLESLLFKSANGKVAQVLLGLAEQHGEPTSAGTLINYPITHQEIGNLIATTRETVSYAFMEFRQRGLISTRARKTIILDPDALSTVALD